MDKEPTILQVRKLKPNRYISFSVALGWKRVKKCGKGKGVLWQSLQRTGRQRTWPGLSSVKFRLRLRRRAGPRFPTLASSHCLPGQVTHWCLRWPETWRHKEASRNPVLLLTLTGWVFSSTKPKFSRICSQVYFLVLGNETLIGLNSLPLAQVAPRRDRVYAPRY